MSPGRGARRARLQARDQVRVKALAERWARQRYAVPYDTEGPKVTLGVAWFGAAVAAAALAPLALAVVVAPVAGLAAWQAARAWHHEVPVEDRLAAAVAVGSVLAGLGGLVGLGVAVVAATLGVAAAAVALGWSAPPGPSVAARATASAWDRRLRAAEVAVRVSVPVGLAGGSLVGLAGRGSGAVVALLLIVSAYEAADFIIGTGSSNAVEGPLAGVVSALVVAVVVAAVQPSVDGVALGLLAAAVVLAPAGQVVASALLPRGAAWAPALRRLDSYLLAAPLWFVLG